MRAPAMPIESIVCSSSDWVCFLPAMKWMSSMQSTSKAR